MTLRTLLLLASASCAFVAAGIGFGWGLFDLDDPALRHDHGGYIALAALFFAVSFLPWDRMADRWERR